MRRALAVASSFPEDVPVGAVVFDADGVELAAAGNEREATGDPTAHAEILVLRRAALLTDLGITAHRLLTLCSQEGMLPSDVTAEISQRLGCADELDELREA